MRRVALRNLKDLIDKEGELSGTVSQDIDLTQVPVEYWQTALVADAYFLGCNLGPSGLEQDLRGRGATIVPRFSNLVYDPYRAELYSQGELAAGYEPGKRTSLDERIFDRYVADNPLKPDIIEALARRTHDFSIDRALDDLLDEVGKDRAHRRSHGRVKPLTRRPVLCESRSAGTDLDPRRLLRRYRRRAGHYGSRKPRRLHGEPRPEGLGSRPGRTCQEPGPEKRRLLYSKRDERACDVPEGRRQPRHSNMVLWPRTDQPLLPAHRQVLLQ